VATGARRQHDPLLAERVGTDHDGAPVGPGNTNRTSARSQPRSGPNGASTPSIETKSPIDVPIHRSRSGRRRRVSPGSANAARTRIDGLGRGVSSSTSQSADDGPAHAGSTVATDRAPALAEGGGGVPGRSRRLLRRSAGGVAPTGGPEAAEDCMGHFGLGDRGNDPTTSATAIRKEDCRWQRPSSGARPIVCDKPLEQECHRTRKMGRPRR
jgi:hypothetical protein